MEPKPKTRMLCPKVPKPRARNELTKKAWLVDTLKGGPSMPSKDPNLSVRLSVRTTLHSGFYYTGSIWEFPKIGGPSIVK